MPDLWPPETDETPLFMLPGMGADARMFRDQIAAFPQLQVFTWIPPEPRETLPHYAERMVDHRKPSSHSFIGGASFGGVVALEMANLIRPKACFLIGSLRSTDELRPVYRRIRGLAGLTRVTPGFARVGLWTIGFGLRSVSRDVLRQLSAADGRFLHWATRALLGWQPSAGISQLTILQIHGRRDWVIPASRSHAEHIVSGAGHLISITHANAVNEFLRAGMQSHKQ